MNNTIKMNDNNIKKSGIIHKLVRKKILEYVKPGVLLYDIRKNIETWICEYSNSTPNTYDYINSSIAFPVGLSINNIAAHHSPFFQDKTVYTENDILKIDYGIQFNGEMVDAAFSITHNPELEKLKEISEEATNKVIKLSGIDTVLCDLGREIEEIFTSYELEINGKLYPIKPCRDLCGHQILPYKIHGKKVIPNINISYQNRMDEGEIYAVETFPTTGSGHLKEGKGNSHLMINYNIVGNDKYKKIPTYKRIMDKRKTLPWHLDWLEKDPFIKLNELRLLIGEGLVTEYPPLYDIESSYVAQTEHTIGIFENGVVQYT